MGKGARAYIAPLNSSDVPDALHQAVPSLLKDASTNGYTRTLKQHDEEESIPLFTLVTTYISYFILILYGHLRDYMDYFLSAKLSTDKPGYAPINSGFDTFYTRRLYARYFINL